MTDRNRNALIGLFVLGALVALGVLIVLFGESQGLFRQRYFVNVKFRTEEVPNLRPGADVTIAGVWAGSVAEVSLADRTDPAKGVFARLEINEDISIPRSSRAAVVTPLMGQPSVNIVPPPAGDRPEPPVARDGSAEIPGSVTNPLETVIDPRVIATLEKSAAQIGNLAEALTPAAHAVEDLLKRRTIADLERARAAREDLPANLSTAIERLHSVLEHIDAVIGDPAVRSNLKLTLENFRAASENARAAVESLRAFAEDARTTGVQAQALIGKLDKAVDTTHAHVDVLGRKLIENSDRLARVLDYGVAIGRDMAEGQGTIGLLLRDPKFHDELMLTVQRLGDAANELKVLIVQWQEKGLLGVR